MSLDCALVRGCTDFALLMSRAAEILLAFKKAVGDPNVLKSWVGEPCSAVWRGVNCSGGVQSGEVTSL